LFLSNAHFASRKVTFTLDATLGLEARPGTKFALTSHFPDRRQLRRDDGAAWKLGDTVDVWLRPFETLMLEVAPTSKATRLPARAINAVQAADLGTTLTLRPTAPVERLDARFASAELFATKKFTKKSY